MINEKPVVLAVDNDILVLETVQDLLKHDFNVTTAASGKAAIEFLLTKSADLILLEVDIGDMSGIEILDLINVSPKNNMATVIFLTNDISEADQVEAIEKGAADYVLKPIRSQVLLHRIKMQMELRMYRNSLEQKASEQNTELREAYDNLKKLENITIDLLSRVIKFRDKQAEYKIESVAEYIALIVEALMEYPSEGYIITEAMAEDIVKSCKFHDIGMIAVSDDILLKGGKLTEYEYDIVRKHTVIGGDMLKEAIDSLGDDSFLNIAYDMAMFHHEKWSGDGYPNKLKGTEIPLPARIVALVDVYDALISSRPYRKAFSHEQAVRLIMEGNGTNFDPHLVEVLLKIQDKFEEVNIRFNT